MLCLCHSLPEPPCPFLALVPTDTSIALREAAAHRVWGTHVHTHSVWAGGAASGHRRGRDQTQCAVAQSGTATGQAGDAMGGMWASASNGEHLEPRWARQKEEPAVGGWVSGCLAPHPWHCSTAPLPWPPCLQPKFQPLHMPTVLILPPSPGRQAGPQAPRPGEVPVTSRDAVSHSRFPRCVCALASATPERVQQPRSCGTGDHQQLPAVGQRGCPG